MVDIRAYEGEITTGLNYTRSNTVSSIIKMYPNPSVDGVVFIECDEQIKKVILVNMLGQTENHFSNIIQTDFKGLVDVRVETNRGTANTKIVLQ